MTSFRTLIFSILFFTFLFACKNQKQDLNKIKRNLRPLETLKAEMLYNKIFYKITKTDSVDVIYNYCDANVNTIKVYKDSIWEDFGQEIYTMPYTISKINNKTIFLINPKQRDFAFQIFDKSKGYWKINNNIFIDSLMINTILQYKQPCIECWDKEDCDEMEKIKNNK